MGGSQNWVQGVVNNEVSKVKFGLRNMAWEE